MLNRARVRNVFRRLGFRRRVDKPSPLRADDRGRALHFHGRDKIIAAFDKRCRICEVQQDGTTFLIQGAPGAGKTALLDVLMRRAKDSGWQTWAKTDTHCLGTGTSVNAQTPYPKYCLRSP